MTVQYMRLRNARDTKDCKYHTALCKVVNHSAEMDNNTQQTNKQYSSE